MPTSRITAAITVLALALAAACGNDNIILPYAVYEGEPNGDGALLQGTLTLDRDCLYIKNAEGLWYLAFAEDTAEWDPGTSTLSLGSTTATSGDEVSVGGSALLVQAFARDWATEPGDNCDTEHIWISGTTLGQGPAASR